MPLLSRVLAPFVTLVLVAGCGADPDPGVPPKQWATTVCGALTPWRQQITTLTEEAKQQITATSTPAQTKERLVTLLRGAEDASDAARAGVQKAGVPRVDGGDEIARRFVKSLTTARDAYAHARTAIEALPTAEAKAFYDGVVAAWAKLTDEYAASALDTRNVSSTQLRAAFAEVPECR